MTTLETGISMADVQANKKPLRQLAVEHRTAYWAKMVDAGFDMCQRIEQRWDEKTRCLIFVQDDKYNRLEQRKVDRAREKIGEAQRELQCRYPYIFAF